MFMSQISAAAASPFGIASLIFLALGIAGLFGLVGKGARVSLAVAGIGSFAILFVVAILFPLPVPGSGDDTQVAIIQPPPAQDPAQTQERLPRDVRRALELLAEAEQHNNLGRTDEARETFAKAEERFRDADSLDGIGAVAMGLGNLEAYLGQSDEAREAYGRALAFFRQAGNTESQALVLAALGDLEKTTLQFEQARAAYAEAREVFAEARGANGAGHLLLGLEALAAHPDGEEAARRDLAEAHLLYQQIEDPNGLALVATITADLERELGNFNQAYIGYREAIFLMGGGTDRSQLAETWYHLGVMELDLGFHNTAAEALGQAVALYQSLGAYDAIALGQMALARLNRILGDYEQSYLRYTAALEAYTGVGDTDGQALAIFGMAESGRRVGRWMQAQDRYSQAAKIFDRRGAAGNVALVLMSQAQMEIGVRIAEPLGQAAVAAGNATDDRARGLVFLAWGSFQASSGDPAIAREFLGLSAQAFQRAGLALGSAAAAAALAALERDLGDSAAADRALAEAKTLMAGLDDPLKAANQVLGFGNFGQLLLHLEEQGEDIEYALDDEGARDEAQRAAAAAADGPPPEPDVDPHAEALIPYPKANAEALAFLADVTALLAAP
jgi:tetratricopeptide (TPR) repeat protein